MILANELKKILFEQAMCFLEVTDYMLALCIVDAHIILLT